MFPISVCASFGGSCAVSRALRCPPRLLARPSLRSGCSHQFAIGLTLAGFSLAALYVNRDTAIWLHRMSGGSTWRFGRDPSDRDLQNAARMQRVKRAQETLNTLPKTLGWLPDIMLVPVLRLYVIWEEWKINTPAAHSAPAMLIGGMGAIFLAWQVPRLQPFMSKWFMHRSVVFGGSKTQWKNCVTMFTSTVSLQRRGSVRARD